MGGPLVYEATLIGIVTGRSYGETTDTVDVHLKIYYYLDFIKEHVGSNTRLGFVELHLEDGDENEI